VLHGRSATALAEVRERIGGDPLVVTGDVTVAADLDRMHDQVMERHGRVDILVANAGNTTSRPKPIEDVTEESWRADIDQNLTGTFLTVRRFLPDMKQRRAGAIITLSSAAGRKPSERTIVAYAVAKVGRAETSTDPSPLNMTETLVHLRPRAEWREGMTLEALRAEMSRAVERPGVANIWTMPIINRIDMLTTGVRSEVGVKVFGADLDVLGDLSRRIAAVLRTVPGAGDVYPEPLLGGQYLNVTVDRAAAARHGLSVAAVQDVVAACGEKLGATLR